MLQSVTSAVVEGLLSNLKCFLERRFILSDWSSNAYSVKRIKTHGLHIEPSVIAMQE